MTAVYPNIKVSEQLLDIWSSVLSDIRDEQIMMGLEICLREHTTGFPPTPAQFRKYAGVVGSIQRPERPVKFSKKALLEFEEDKKNMLLQEEKEAALRSKKWRKSQARFKAYSDRNTPDKVEAAKARALSGINALKREQAGVSGVRVNTSFMDEVIAGVTN